MIASLKSETTGKLIRRILGSRLLIASLPGSASRTHVEPLGKPRDSTRVLETLLVNLISKDTSPNSLFMFGQIRK